MTSHMDKAELLVHGKEVAKQSVHNYVRNVVFETLSKLVSLRVWLCKSCQNLGHATKKLEHANNVELDASAAGINRKRTSHERFVVLHGCKREEIHGKIGKVVGKTKKKLQILLDDGGTAYVDPGQRTDVPQSTRSGTAQPAADKQPRKPRKS